MTNRLEIFFHQIAGEVRCVYCDAFYPLTPVPNSNGWHIVQCPKCHSTINYDSPLLVFEHNEINPNVNFPESWYGRDTEFTPTKKDVFELGAYLHQVALTELEDESQEEGLCIAESDIEAFNEIESFLISHPQQFTIQFFESEPESEEISSIEPISVQ